MIRLHHELYKAQEVADMLRIDIKTLYVWIQKGQVKTIRTPSGRIRVPRGEVVRMFAQQADSLEPGGS